MRRYATKWRLFSNNIDFPQIQHFDYAVILIFGCADHPEEAQSVQRASRHTSDALFGQSGTFASDCNETGAFCSEDSRHRSRAVNSVHLSTVVGCASDEHTKSIGSTSVGCF